MPDFKRRMTCTEGTKVMKAVCLAVCLAGLLLSGVPASAEWKIDLSRRQKSVRDSDLTAAAMGDGREPASARVGDEGGGDGGPSMDSPSTEKKGLFDTLFEAGDPVQEVVILNTEKGFVPNTVRVRKGGRYLVHVVNVNEKEKNVSFILDGFSEHHATFYGKVKTFNLEPKKEGVYSFQSPETSAEGRLVVFNPEIVVRNPASDGGTK